MIADYGPIGSCLSSIVGERHARRANGRPYRRPTSSILFNAATSRPPSTSAMAVLWAILPRQIGRPRTTLPPCGPGGWDGESRHCNGHVAVGTGPTSALRAKPALATHHHADVRSRLRCLDLHFGLERRSELRSVVFPHHDEAAQEVVAPTRILYFNAFHLGRVNSRPFVYQLMLADI